MRLIFIFIPPEGSCSFLKKRTKKLLLLACREFATPPAQSYESFLLLFFKKEVLSFGSRSASPKRQHKLAAQRRKLTQPWRAAW
jgi:hypothetical protein